MKVPAKSIFMPFFYCFSDCIWFPNVNLWRLRKGLSSSERFASIATEEAFVSTTKSLLKSGIARIGDSFILVFIVVNSFLDSITPSKLSGSEQIGDMCEASVAFKSLNNLVRLKNPRVPCGYNQAIIALNFYGSGPTPFVDSARPKPVKNNNFFLIWANSSSRNHMAHLMDSINIKNTLRKLSSKMI